jgi:uncharacterized protein YceH (UPF0502 family)
MLPAMEPLTPEEVRVVGCLIEKQLATPDYYPMTENALVAACNQSSNRNPVVAYDNDTVRLTLNSLRVKSLARIMHIHGGRVPKHRHVLDEALELDRPGLALLCVLALRGPQTTGELRTRTERLHTFDSTSAVEEVLENLASRDEPLVVRLERQPGQKEARYAHLLSGPPDETAVAAADFERPRAGASDRLAALEARVEALEDALAELRKELGT